MRWLLVTPEFPPDAGGVARYLGVLAEGSEDWLSVASPHGPIETRLDWRLPPRWLPSVWHVAKLLRGRDRTGLVISHVLPLGYAALVAWYAGFEYAVVCHGLDVMGPLGNPWKRFWAGFALRKARAVIANSEATATVVRRYGVEARRLHVVNPPLSWEPGSIWPRYESDFVARHSLEGKRTMLAPGRVVARKGFGVAVRAFAGLAADFPDAVLAVVGGGPERLALRGLAESLGVGDRVIFAGHVSEAEMRDAYRAAEIVVAPSLELPGDIEGFGIAAADAGAFAKPVVASRTGGLPEAVHDGESGVLVPPGDVEALSGAIRGLLADPGRAKALGAGGLSLARSRTHESFRAAFKAALADAL